MFLAKQVLTSECITYDVEMEYITQSNERERKNWFRLTINQHLRATTTTTGDPNIVIAFTNIVISLLSPSIARVQLDVPRMSNGVKKYANVRIVNQKFI